MKKNPRIRSAASVGGVATLGLALAAVGVGASFASTHGGSGGTTCSVPSAYRTIQAAVDAVTCKTIKVAPGTYAENVKIPRSVTLTGAKSGQDARNRRGSGESIIKGNLTASITITADNVTIDGFTLNGPVDRGSAAIVMQTANSGETIQNNIVNNPGRAASITTSRTTFRRNVVRNTATANDGFQANSTPVHDVVISDNSFSGAVPSGYNADITFIEGNKNITVEDNTSTGDGTLIALFKTAGATITGNSITGASASSAIYIGGADSKVSVTGNAISSAGSAVKVANAFGDGKNSSVTISRNILRKNQYGVNVAAGSTSDVVQVTRNSITGNTLSGVDNDPASGASTAATCNWWGSSSGPGTVGPGRGDKVSSGVTFKPWLRSSSLSSRCS